MKKYIFALTVGIFTLFSFAQAQDFTNLNGNGNSAINFSSAPGYGFRISNTFPISEKAQLRISVANPVAGAYSTAMVINTDGKIGIGTIFAGNAPYEYSEYRLYVKDGIRTEKVKVDIGTGSWGDFVFKADYNLMPLTELQKYIKAQNHLPNVPSAKEIEKQGLNLGEMQRLQMIKIEELTLYLLELKKENDELRERVQKLEKQVKNGQN